MSQPLPGAQADGPVEFQFGRYRVQGLLGSGGMASVYRAEDSATGQIVALKVMSRDLEGDPEYRARFVREARMLQVIRHPNVVQVMDAGEEDGRPYFAMECLSGEDLEQRIRRDGPLNWRAALELMRQALRGLASAWSAGLIHRDVKPENLFIADGVLKVMDFGVARPLLSDGFQTQAGMVVGTPAYIAPEQAMGRKVDLRADLYSLGATFFHIISGHTPYGEAQPSQLCASHVYDPFPPISQFMPDLPKGVVDLFARLAEKDPAKRGDQISTLATIDALLGLPAEGAAPVLQGPSLVIHAGRGTGTRSALPEGQEVIIGRMPGCGLTIDDARASRRHAVVVRRGTSVEVRDLGSRNGIQVNGQNALVALIKDGDTITIGDTVVRLEGVAASAGSPAARTATLPPAQPPPTQDIVIQRAAFGPGAVSTSPGSLVMPPGPPPAPRPPPETVHDPAAQASFDALAAGRVPQAESQPGHLVVLARLVRAARDAADAPELARQVLQVLVEAVPFDRGYLLLPAGPSRDAAALRPLASRDAQGQPLPAPPEPGLVRRAWEQGLSVLTGDGSGPGTVVAPLRVAAGAAGVLLLERAAPRRFAPADQVLVEAVAEFCAEALTRRPAAPPPPSPAARSREDLLALLGPSSKAQLEAVNPVEWPSVVTPRLVPAAVVFCDLRDFPALSERVSPAESAALLGQYLAMVEDALAAEGGLLVRGGAEECVGVVGVPVPQENASFSAVRAGAAILQGMASLHRNLPADRRLLGRVGVCTGPVLAGVCGTPRREAYVVVGEAVGIAAAMVRQAGPATLSIAETTLRELRGAVPAVPRGALALRHRGMSVNIFEVPPPGPVAR